MKEVFFKSSVQYEQLALDYFLAHIFLEEDYFYHMLYYVAKIDGSAWQFDPTGLPDISDPDGYLKDESVAILQAEGILSVDPKPAGIRIAAYHDQVEMNADNIDLEVFTRTMLKKGNYMVKIELRGYRFQHEFYLEINPADNTIVKWFDTKMSF